MFDENSNNLMTMVNHLMNVKDSRWLQLEVCREFQRGQCSRTENECKFAHPPAHVEVQNGRVTACYDSIKARCQRDNPKCKYLHPPQHLKDQLLINGKNHLALKNMLMSQLNSPLAAAAQTPMLSPLTVGTGSTYAAGPAAAVPTVAAFSPYYANSALNAALYPQLIAAAASPEHSMLPAVSLASVGGMFSQTASSGSPVTSLAALPKQPRADRLEAAAAHSAAAGGQMQPQQFSVGQKRPLEATFGVAAAALDPLLLAACGLQPQSVKRPALEKSGLPVYQPQVQMQAPVSVAMSLPAISAASLAAAHNQAAAAFMPQLHPLSGLHSPFLPAISCTLLDSSFHGVQSPAAALLPAGPSAALSHLVAAATQLAQPQPAAASNASAVAYFDESGQLLDTLPVCRDFKQGHCERSSCRYVHLLEEYVEVSEGRVTVCRDAAKGRCQRLQCKYYHLPLQAPQLGWLPLLAAAEAAPTLLQSLPLGCALSLP